jgi:hypothetical protein
VAIPWLGLVANKAVKRRKICEGNRDFRGGSGPILKAIGSAARSIRRTQQLCDGCYIGRIAKAPRAPPPHRMSIPAYLAPKTILTVEAISSFRDLTAMCVVPLSRARSAAKFLVKKPVMAPRFGHQMLWVFKWEETNGRLTCNLCFAEFSRPRQRTQMGRGKYVSQPKRVLTEPRESPKGRTRLFSARAEMRRI